jgi:transcriptional regulator with XRE-family HTH domain
MSKSIKNRRNTTKVCLCFGERVRALRKRKKWSLEEFAERAGMHVTYLSSIERGYRNPTLNVMAAISAAFNISLSLLLKGISEDK